MLDIIARAERIATSRDDWQGFADEIAAVELELADCYSASARRAIHTDGRENPPGHHERNLLGNVRVAIAKLKECM